MSLRLFPPAVGRGAHVDGHVAPAPAEAQRTVRAQDASVARMAYSSASAATYRPSATRLAVAAYHQPTPWVAAKPSSEADAAAEQREPEAKEVPRLEALEARCHPAAGRRLEARARRIDVEQHREGGEHGERCRGQLAGAAEDARRRSGRTSRARQ